MKPCACREPHPLKRVVLTGGPGAGKTAVLDAVRESVCEHVVVLPEAASVVFGGGFPRTPREGIRRAAQRAIYFVQRELESAADTENPAIELCDRGTVDGAAYWPGPDTLWSSLGVMRTDELARYDSVMHLRTPSAAQGYARTNPLRLESATDALRIDDRIRLAWDGHPRVSVVDASTDFVVKATQVIALVRAELPACCRAHPIHIARPTTSPTLARGQEVNA